LSGHWYQANAQRQGNAPRDEHTAGKAANNRALAPTESQNSFGASRLSGEKSLSPRRPVAKLHIATLGIPGLVEEAFDAQTVDSSIGMFPQGARPGEPGQMVLAAHGDTLFYAYRLTDKGGSCKIPVTDSLTVAALKACVDSIHFLSRERERAVTERAAKPDFARAFRE